MIKAELYQKQDDGSVDCRLCAHYCHIPAGETGNCHVRKNIDGVLYSMNANNIIAMAADPIEKKPLYHFVPASISFSIAAMGCNFKCAFCQNHSISMVHNIDDISGRTVSAERIVREATNAGAKSIAYTYTEPTVYFEILEQSARLVRDSNMKNVMVSNGYLSDETIDRLSPLIDGINIDLKAFNDSFYKRYCKAKLSPVLNTIRRMHQKGIHIELTTLLINGENDDPDEIRQLIDFILSVDPEIPWHVSRFYPSHHFDDRLPTDIYSIYDIVETGKEMGLAYIYSGNIHNNRYADTRCPDCNALLIERSGYNTRVIGLRDGHCTECNRPIKGIWK